MLAQESFGDQLVLAFVGGSRASGNATQRSDIDLFVVVERSDRQSEEILAQALRKLHHDHDLQFDHYGEIFDLDTLRTLIEFTEKVTELDSTIVGSACYQGNCLLSAYRKGRVVIDFLAAPKECIVDPWGVLNELSSRSARYRRAWNQPHPPSSNTVNLDFMPALDHLRNRWNVDATSTNRLDSPIGIQLGRWFGASLLDRLRHPITLMIESADLKCPIETAVNVEPLVAHIQCLSALPREAEGPSS